MPQNQKDYQLCGSGQDEIEYHIIGIVMSQEIDGTIAGIAELFCPDYYTRIKIRDVNIPYYKVLKNETTLQKAPNQCRMKCTD